MVHYFEPTQVPVGTFADRQTAEVAYKALQAAGFESDHLTLVPETIDPHMPMKKTEAANSARAGAITGTVLGGLVGFIFASMSLGSGGIWVSNSTIHILGLMLMGSGFGALSVGLWGALMGAGVHRGLVEPEYKKANQTYIILAAGSPEELDKAQSISHQNGGKVPDLSEV